MYVRAFNLRSGFFVTALERSRLSLYFRAQQLFVQAFSYAFLSACRDRYTDVYLPSVPQISKAFPDPR